MSDAWDDESEVVTVKVEKVKKWADEDVEKPKPKPKQTVSVEQKAREDAQKAEHQIKLERSQTNLKATFANPGRNSLRSKVLTHAEQVEKQNKERSRLEDLARWLNCEKSQVERLLKILPKAELEKRIAEGKRRDTQ